ncbi:helix-turn-helix domain-containing protein [Arthrobacter sp. AQ5-05]|uniref:DUF6431 domain-containing protein n=1 Tax=Arthrobacter sp. AQ5-05 TaxID=2184581 RepID=UPI000DCE4CC7|nr:DUF6431 domain-containing protein [Arthrobacter sp. AQ5-05]RAX45519.1 helix-turn-helix domain-containing protein [Arthrobacter sp. AQ5-05]
MMIVGSPEQTEALLLAGEIPCPDCSVQLRPHGHARTRTVRGQGDERLTLQPRRARCTSCRRTQVLLPAALSVRRADTLEVIGAALAAKAGGSGYRTIAARMGRPLSTVRRWLRRVPEKHAHWLYGQAVQHAFRLDPEILVRPKRWPSLLGWSLNVLAGAALAHRRWVGTDLPPWTLIGLFTRGNLLSPPLRI